MRTLARTCALAGAGLTALALAGVPAAATYRGTNGLLVYQAEVGKHVQLFTVQADGHGQRQITHLPDSDALSAAWSPDGSQIAFARDYAEGTRKEHLDIFTIDADGGGLHGMRLTGLNGDPTWSPDGSEILWVRPGGFGIASADGTGLQTIHVSGDLGSPTFSPDGTRIAFLRALPKGARAIFIVRANGSHPQRVLTSSKGLGDKIDWSPDGSRIAYSSPAFGEVKNVSTNVFTIRTNGTGRRKLTHASGGTINAGLDSWSPDGKQIAIVDSESGTNQIYAINADGSGLRPLTHGPESHLAAWGSHA